MNSRFKLRPEVEAHDVEERRIDPQQRNCRMSVVTSGLPYRTGVVGRTYIAS